MPDLLFSDNNGNILSDPQLQATGMEGRLISRLDASELIRLPPGARLFMMPSRKAVGYDPVSAKFVTLRDRLSVAAFLPAGYTATYSASYVISGAPKQLPLLSYAAACIHKNELYAAAVNIDRDRRHDCRYIDIDRVTGSVVKISALFPKNRLINHLSDCALVHGCPNAQNFFLSRYEAPLPVSPVCNSSCYGCISLQRGKSCPASQPRITFVPASEEIAEIAVFHIERTKDPIVSFGQGCEGEPLLQHKLIAESIRRIRKVTAKGTIHINSNGSMPDALKALISAGLDSVRISLNSARDEYYTMYYRPKGYSFSDVTASIRTADKGGIHVSLNYLTMPGFTDMSEEFQALKRLLRKHKIDMIQWRNLNYDPLKYFEQLKVNSAKCDLLGIKNLISSLKKEFPRIRMGYFNPSIR